MKKPISLIIICLMLMMLGASGCESNSALKPVIPATSGDQVLLVAAASSLTDVLSEIKSQYAVVHPDVELVFTFASSGSLQTQIEEGSPVDVFISASQKQIDVLDTKNLILTGSIKNILTNELVLIIPGNHKTMIDHFSDLTSSDIFKVACGDPASVPAGLYAQQVFESLGISEDLSEKLILATDVRQVLAWVETGDVDAGLVYASDAMSSNDVRVVCNAPADSHRPIVYPAAIIRSSIHLDAARDWMDFLSSETAVATFTRFGFKVS